MQVTWIHDNDRDPRIDTMQVAWRYVEDGTWMNAEPAHARVFAP